MAASTDFQVVPETGVEVELLAVEACDGGGGSATITTEESVKKVLQEQPAVDARDGARSGSATTTMDESMKVLQEQPVFEACDGAGSRSATTTTEEESVTVLQEQRDTAPDQPADHHEAVAPNDAATEVSAWKAEPVEEKPHPHVAKEEQGEQKVPAGGGDDQESTRERLKRHRQEMAGRVWVPEMWGQEKLLKDWVDSAVFDRPLVPAGLLTARRALVAESCTRRPDRTSTVSSAGSSPLRVRNGCST